MPWIFIHPVWLHPPPPAINKQLPTGSSQIPTSKPRFNLRIQICLALAWFCHVDRHRKTQTSEGTFFSVWSCIYPSSCHQGHHNPGIHTVLTTLGTGLTTYLMCWWTNWLITSNIIISYEISTWIMWITWQAMPQDTGYKLLCSSSQRVIQISSSQKHVCHCIINLFQKLMIN